MNQVDPEKYVEAGVALVQLGRMLQRSFPPPNVVGCQFDEGPILDKLLPGNNGLYIDIGANHPTDCSNTWQFYKRGWRGLLIEPLPATWPGLLWERPRDRVVPVACSNINGWATLHACRSVSSLREDWREDKEGSFPVRTATLETILAQHNDIDWSKTRLLSVDCEGSEQQVFEIVPWDSFKPNVIVAEWSDQNGADISQGWMPILKAQGYSEAHRNRLNIVMKLN